MDIGDIILINNLEKDWFSAAQRFFTGKPFTHSAVGVGRVMGYYSILEADILVEVTPVFKTLNQNIEYSVYEVHGVNKNELFEIVKELYIEYSTKSYGYFQLLWFAFYRWLFELFGKDVRKKNNWFTSGVICSELVWYYFEKLGKKHFPQLLETINEWLPNTFHSGDVNNVVERHPEIFKLKETNLK